MEQIKVILIIRGSWAFLKMAFISKLSMQESGAVNLNKTEDNIQTLVNDWKQELS